jgi:photosystem II stability/assembly factor-like uncharacterized protein
MRQHPGCRPFFQLLALFLEGRLFEIGDNMCKKMKFKSWTCSTRTLSVWVTFVAFLLAAAPSHAANDQLLLPAEKVKAEEVASSMLMDIVNTGTRLVAVGERGHILYSDDDGRNWVQADVPVSVTLTAVYFPSPEKGWAVGHDGVVLHTEDGGKSWTKQRDALKGMELDLAHGKKLIKVMTDELASASAENRPALESQLENIRFIFDEIQTAVERNYCCDPLTDVWFKNDSEGFVVGSYGAIYHTEDSGTTWIPWWENVDNPDRLHLNAIVEAKGALFIAGETGTLYRSLDGGKRFEALPSPYEGSFFGTVADPGGAYVIAFGLGGNLVYSTDMGDSWHHKLTKAGSALSGATARADGIVTMVSYSGAVLVGPVKGPYLVKTIMSGWTGVAEAADGNTILVGLGGVHRLALDSKDSGGK